LYGEESDDRIYGDAGNDTIIGGAGEDEIFGGEGDDTIEGGKGKDEIDGGAGNDIIDGGLDDDEIIDTEGDNTFYSYGGRDTFETGVGQNTFYIIGESDREDKISYLDSDDIFMFRVEVCTNYVTVNVGSDISSDVVKAWAGPYKVSIKHRTRGRPSIAKICNKGKKCQEFILPTTVDDAGCV
jgi:Ca2+-binding RTX toxin-like protein